MGRGVRLAKMSKVLDSLQLILKCITSSVATLSWSLCILFVTQCIVGMIVSQFAIDYVNDRSNHEESRLEVFRYFGTFSLSMISMSEVHLANWAPVVRVLLDNLGIWHGGMLTAYR